MQPPQDWTFGINISWHIGSLSDAKTHWLGTSALRWAVVLFPYPKQPFLVPKPISWYFLIPFLLPCTVSLCSINSLLLYVLCKMSFTFQSSHDYRFYFLSLQNPLVNTIFIGRSCLIYYISDVKKEMRILIPNGWEISLNCSLCLLACDLWLRNVLWELEPKENVSQDNLLLPSVKRLKMNIHVR